MKKNNILVGTVLIIISIGLCIYREFSYQQLSDKRISIHDITNSGAKEEDVNAYLNASFIADALASRQNDKENSFYVIFGDDVQYIVYLNNNDAKRINEYLLDNPNSFYRIVGKTKVIPKDLESYGRDFIKKWLDANHNHASLSEDHSHEISSAEFYEYFGYIYLDTTISKYSEFKTLSTIMYISVGIGLTIILSKIYVKYVI